MLVGVTGYGVAVLFILHGAPDLAITQMLVETVALVVFVLALRRHADEVHPPPPLARPRTWRLALGVAVGAAVGSHRARGLGRPHERPPSRWTSPTEAYNFGHGKNIVNVTLVDIRAWDTLGEVSVLVAAATGIASLIFVRTRNTRLSRATGQVAAAEQRRPAAPGCSVAARWPRRSGRSSSRW